MTPMKYCLAIPPRLIEDKINRAGRENHGMTNYDKIRFYPWQLRFLPYRLLIRGGLFFAAVFFAGPDGVCHITVFLFIGGGEVVHHFASEIKCDHQFKCRKQMF